MHTLALRNQLDQWRAAPAEHLVHAAAAVALLLVVVLAARNPLRALAQWTPTAGQILLTGASLLLAAAIASRLDARRAQHDQQTGWLAATAWPQAARQQALRRAVLLKCAIRIATLWLLVAALLLLRSSAAPALLLPILLLASVLAMLAARLADHGLHPADGPAGGGRMAPAVTAVPAGCTGLQLLQHGWRTPPLQSQRLQAALGLLLLPGGLSGVAGIVMLSVLLALLWGGRCYSHFRDSCWAATRWLSATTLPTPRLAGALLPPMAGRLLLVAALVAISLMLAGLAPLVIALAAGAALAVLALATALVLVHRAQPRRYRMAVLLQTLLPALLAQTLAPLAALLWLVLLVRAIRTIGRPSILR